MFKKRDQMKRKLYIWGWWQGNNLGDNWIKNVLGRIFPDAQFVDTTVQEFEKNSFVICGGGGLFIYDVIEPWNRLPKNINYGILGLGAEFPHKTSIAIDVYKNAKFFYVRDQYSLDCMHLSNIERSYDLTFSFPLVWSKKEDTNSRKVFFVWRDGHELMNNSQFEKYISIGSTYEDWVSIINKNFDIVIEDDFQTREDNISERIGDAGFVVSGRYHGIVAAIQRGVPFVAIDICPKIRSLLSECGLDEYCIKLSEISKLDSLIKKAQKNVDEVRVKERKYVKKANEILTKQLELAKFEILKVLMPLNVLHYGSYWMKENDVVNTMADDLEKCCKLKKFVLKVYSSHPDKRIDKNENTPNGKLCELNSNRVRKDIDKYKAEVIVLNSGGLTLKEDFFSELSCKGVTTVGISLSDPDVFPYNGKLYADKFDLFYTNSKYSLINEYPITNANVYILPFAASTNHHFYMPEIKRKYDLVVVAHAREERISVIDKLEKICCVGTYGNGWKRSLGTVNGLEHVKAINSGRMYLSFARTVAGFDNVKVGLFEAMACNQVVITSYMDELQDYFDIGTEILCYKSEEELYGLVSYYSEHSDELEEIRRRGYARFLREHTYVKRWDEVMKQIYKIKHLL